MKYVLCRVTLPVLLLLAVACANREQAIYKSLQVSQVAYEEVTDEIQERFEDRRITRDQVEQLIPITEKWAVTHNAAVEAFAQYKKSQEEESMETVMRLLEEANQLVLQLEELLDSWGMAVLE